MIKSQVVSTAQISTVPTGLVWRWTPCPSDESLGYFHRVPTALEAAVCSVFALISLTFVVLPPSDTFCQ